MSTGSKGRKCVEALLQRPLKTGGEVDTDLLHLNPVQVLVEVAELNDGSMINRIERVLPPEDREPGDDDEIPF